jgi:hypothetical protein
MFKGRAMPQVSTDDTARRALRQACAALDAAELRGRPIEMSLTLTRLARCYAAHGQLASAEACLQAALRWAGAAGAIDHQVDLLCELCETAARIADRLAAEQPDQPGAARAARERARDHAFDAAALVGRAADAGWEVKVLLRISDVLDRCGDRDEAVLLQTRALRLMAGHSGRTDSALLPGLGRLADV